MPIPKRRILKDFDLDEISSVDRPAQVTATMAIIKSYVDKNEHNAMTFADALMATRLNDSIWPMTDALRTTVHSIVESEEMDGAAKATAISESINDFANQMHSIVDDDPINKIAMTILADQIGGSKEGDTMPTPEELQKQLTDLTASVATLTTALDIAKAHGALNDAEKAFASAMDDTDRQAFAKLSAAERKQKMDLHKSQDETLEVNGQTISKADVGAGTFDILKSQQEDIAKNALASKAIQDQLELVTFVKRAETELPHSVGTAEEKGELLKALSGQSETVRKTFDALMKSAEALAAGAFTTAGGGDGSVNQGNDDAAQELEKLAKKYETDNEVTYAQAVTKILEANPELYEASLQH